METTTTIHARTLVTPECDPILKAEMQRAVSELAAQIPPAITNRRRQHYRKEAENAVRVASRYLALAVEAAFRSGDTAALRRISHAAAALQTGN